MMKNREKHENHEKRKKKKETDQFVEVFEKRQRNSKTFKNEETSEMKDIYYFEPIHYKDKDGNFQDINIKFKEHENLFLMEDNEVTVGFRKDSLTYKYVGMRYSDEIQYEISLNKIFINNEEQKFESVKEVKQLEDNIIEHTLDNDMKILNVCNKYDFNNYVEITDNFNQIKIVEKLHIKNLIILNEFDEETKTYKLGYNNEFLIVNIEEEKPYKILKPIVRNKNFNKIQFEINHKLELIDDELIYTKYYDGDKVIVDEKLYIDTYSTWLIPLGDNGSYDPHTQIHSAMFYNYPADSSGWSSLYAGTLYNTVQYSADSTIESYFTSNEKASLVCNEDIKNFNVWYTTEIDKIGQYKRQLSSHYDYNGIWGQIMSLFNLNEDDHVYSFVDCRYYPQIQALGNSDFISKKYFAKRYLNSRGYVQVQPVNFSDNRVVSDVKLRFCVSEERIAQSEIPSDFDISVQKMKSTTQLTYINLDQELQNVYKAYEGDEITRFNLKDDMYWDNDANGWLVDVDIPNKDYDAYTSSSTDNRYMFRQYKNDYLNTQPSESDYNKLYTMDIKINQSNTQKNPRLEIIYHDDKIPMMTSNSTPSGGDVSYGSYYSSSYEGWRAFDNFQDDKWSRWIGGNYQLPTWLKYSFDYSILGNYPMVNKYYILPEMGTVSNRSPYHFKFQGSHNNSTWITLDDRTVEKSSWEWAYNTHHQGMFFDINQSLKDNYRYYRLYIYSVCGSTLVSIRDFALFHG